MTGVRGGQEVGDVVAVGVPAGQGRLEGRCVTGLGRLQDLDGDGDVIVQQGGQLVACGPAVEGCDRVADVLWFCNNRSAVAGKPADPSAKVTIASRVQVMWSSQSLRIWSWKALRAARGDSRRRVGRGESRPFRGVGGGCPGGQGEAQEGADEYCSQRGGLSRRSARAIHGRAFRGISVVAASTAASSVAVVQRPRTSSGSG